LPEGAKGERESLIHFHIARLDSSADRQRLIDGLAKTLNDVRACVTDWRAMRARIEEAIRPSAPIRRRCRSTMSPKPASSCNGCAPIISPLWACANTLLADSDALDDISTGEGLGILRDPDVKVLRRGSEMV